MKLIQEVFQCLTSALVPRHSRFPHSSLHESLCLNEPAEKLQEEHSRDQTGHCRELPSNQQVIGTERERADWADTHTKDPPHGVPQGDINRDIASAASVHVMLAGVRTSEGNDNDDYTRQATAARAAPAMCQELTQAMTRILIPNDTADFQCQKIKSEAARQTR